MSRAISEGPTGQRHLCSLNEIRASVSFSVTEHRQGVVHRLSQGR